MALYIALTLPLPFLAQAVDAPVSNRILGVGVIIGAIALYGALSQRVITDAAGISVTYPAWIRWLLKGSWHLKWQDIRALKPRTTGQGGLVYYFVSQDEQAYLLPMRIAGFARLVRQVETQTGIDTRDIKPLAQPWMYLILLLFTILLLAVDLWVVWTGTQLG